MVFYDMDGIFLGLVRGLVIALFMSAKWRMWDLVLRLATDVAC